MTKAIDRAFKRAIIDGAFPSASLLVAREDNILMAANYGNVRDDACFDIASLTKPFATATITMMLIAEGLLKYDDTVYQWLGGARQPAHRKITVRHLLEHTSGLPPWQPYYGELPLSLIGTEAGKRLILDNCYNEPLIAAPGEKTIYSDIGFIILGEMLEQAGDAPLDALFSQYVGRPLNLKNTFFIRTIGAQLAEGQRRTKNAPEQHVPVSGKPFHKWTGNKDGHRRFVPTEDCPWRKRVIHGEVHDQNAYALGGVAGHAGLFSTALDINLFALELVKCCKGNSDWLPRALVNEFLQKEQKKPSHDKYILGWNRLLRRNSSSGHHFSPDTIGHLAYTGCSIWMDLSKDFRIILLTNRIHPSTTNQKIKAFRPQIHDLIYKELIKA